LPHANYALKCRDCCLIITLIDLRLTLSICACDFLFELLRLLIERFPLALAQGCLFYVICGIWIKPRALLQPSAHSHAHPISTVKKNTQKAGMMNDDTAEPLAFEPERA
jgi:hypothetical protein